MLFRSLGFAGGGAMGGGIGMFDIILIVGILYLIYRFIQKRRAATTPFNQNMNYREVQQPERTMPFQGEVQSFSPESDDVAAGLANIRQMDPHFDENRFNDGVMDMFFKVQGAWMNRDLSPVTGLLTDEMKRIFQQDVDTLVGEKKINRLENIAVRNVEIVEAWQESGQDYITARIYANLLDYTTNDTTGEVLSGSKTDPVKFEEYWTFSRPVGGNSWKLSAISQS
jgi:predicted lipid-binding transport protein (Tim44 family)